VDSRVIGHETEHLDECDTTALEGRVHTDGGFGEGIISLGLVVNGGRVEIDDGADGEDHIHECEFMCATTSSFATL
jgi:hypothetical protein